SSDIPFATNMCLVAWDQLAPGIRLRSVDIILSDVHFWGGFRDNQRMMAVCDAFQIGVGMHSDRELGISTAAMLHLAAASPSVASATDIPLQDRGEEFSPPPFCCGGVFFQGRGGAGWGVKVVGKKLKNYNRLYTRQGQVNEFYDSRRPGWVPSLPIF